jgi:small subunit ribosomal protein S18
MARSSGSDRSSSRRGPKDTGRRIKKKPCALCRDKLEWVDYKDVNLLRKYMSDRGKIRARRVSGNCSQHQRAVALAIRTARELVLLPYTQRTVTERGGGRGRRGERGDRGDRGDRGERGERGERGGRPREGQPAAPAEAGAAGDEGVAPELTALDETDTPAEALEEVEASGTTGSEGASGDAIEERV